MVKKPLIAAIIAAGITLTTAAPANAIEGDDYFTLIVVPDIQYATAYNAPILDAQVGWIHDNIDSLHIAGVLQEGDVVEHEASDTEWATAAAAFAPLDGVVPMTFAAGNHDIQDYSTVADNYPTDSTRYTAFLNSFTNYHVDGSYPEGSMANTYQKLNVLDRKYLIMSLEFGATDDVLAWATQVARDFPDRYVIVLTHDYLGQDSVIRGKPGHAYQYSLPSSFDSSLNDPWQTWDQFVRTSQYVKFVFSGHVTTKTTGYDYSVGKLKSTNAAGRYCYQMLANYQKYQGDGQGFLRIVKIYPQGGRVEVQTYSPYLDQYLTTSKDQFAWDNVNLAAIASKIQT